MLSEEEVYNGSKRWLQKNDFIVLAGQPARGNDHLPVIEIKQATGEKGSKNSYKPDLVAYKDGQFFIIECKPSFDLGDYNKVKEVLSSEQRLRSMYEELRQYRLLERVHYVGTERAFLESVTGVLAYSGVPNENCDLHMLVISDWRGQGHWY